MKIIKKYFDGGEVPRRSTKELALDLAERFRAKSRGAKSERQYGWNEMKQTLQALAPDNNTYNKGWLDGITVTNEGTRPTNRDDWTWAENTQAVQDAAESVRRGIDRNGTPIAAGIYALAAAPFAIEGLGSSAFANGVRTGLQAVDGFFTPSTWLNPVTGTRLLSPAVGTIADSGVLGAFVYDGLNGLYNQYQQGTLLNDPTSTFVHGLEALPLIGLGSKAVGMGVDAWNGSGMKALWDISRSNAPVDLSEYTKLSPKVRIKVGDVEINNPQLAYRQGDKKIINDFLASGEVKTPGGDYGSKKVGRFDLGKSFENPMFAQGYLWYDLPTRAGDGLLVTAEPLGVGSKGSHLVRDTRNGTFDLRYPNVGNSGRRVQLEEGQLSPSNTTAYIWDPNYGYRKVSRIEPSVNITTNDISAITPENIALSGNTNYFKYLDPESLKFFKKYLAQRKIGGLSVDLFDNTILPEYPRGLDLNTKRNLMHNTVERNIRELRNAGLNEELLEAERLAAREALSDVPIGHFTPEEYKAAGLESTGGFITSDGFISVLDNPSFSPQFRKSIPRHEGRHLLQRHLTKPASYYKELPEAYGDDFERLNQWEESPASIKEVKDMRAERETTNRDARDYLFSFDGRDKSLQEADLEFLDRVIDYTPDDKIFEAVENANGYGKTYIKYLRENNLLTPEKAQAFREAMKHVGGYVPWILGGVGYSSLNQR